MILALLSIAGGLLPMIVLGLVVVEFNVDIPAMDEWRQLPMIRASFNDTFSIGMLLEQHNEHRIPLTKAIVLCVARTLRWDTRIELGINYALAIGLFTVLAWSVFRTARQLDSPLALYCIPAISIIVFSLAQHATWFSGWQMQILMSIFFVSASFMLLGGPELGLLRTVGAALLAFMATYSFGNGMIAWPVGALVFIPRLIRSPRATTPIAAIWAFAALSCVGLYYIGYEASPAIRTNLWTVTSMVRYTNVFIGSAIWRFGWSGAEVVGVIGLLLFAGAAVVASRLPLVHRVATAPWLLLALYTLCSAVLTAWGRAGYFGVDQAFSSRYVTISNLFWIGLIVVIAIVVAGRGKGLKSPIGRVALAASGWGAIATAVVLVCASNISEMKAIRDGEHRRENMRWLAMSGEHVNPETGRPLPGSAPIVRWASRVRQYNIAMFRPNAPAPRLFVLDSVDAERVAQGAVDHAGRPYRSRASDAQVRAWKLRQRGAEHARKRQYEDAATAFYESLELDQGHPESLLGLGTALIQLNQPAAAEPFLRQAADSMPDELAPLVNLGAALLILNRPADALDVLERAEEIDSHDLDVLLNSAVAWLLVGDAEKARAYVDAAEALGTTDSRIQLLREDIANATAGETAPSNPERD